MKSHLEMEVIGNTIDDAAGEAFDKCGKVMGFPYPAGPLIDKLAVKEIRMLSDLQNHLLKVLISVSAD